MVLKFTTHSRCIFVVLEGRRAASCQNFSKLFISWSFWTEALYNIAESYEWCRYGVNLANTRKHPCRPLVPKWISNKRSQSRHLHTYLVPLWEPLLVLVEFKWKALYIWAVPSCTTQIADVENALSHIHSLCLPKKLIKFQIQGHALCGAAFVLINHYLLFGCRTLCFYLRQIPRSGSPQTLNLQPGIHAGP